MAFQRGLDAKHEQNQHLILRDTRTMGMRITDFMKEPYKVACLLLCCAVASFILGFIAEIFLVIGLYAGIYCLTRKTTLPFRLPQRCGKKDYNDMIPGNSGKPYAARGIYFFGNEKKTQDELWFSNEDMRTHVLIFGSTGAGKTEALISLAYNALLQASGFIYVDGKGDNGLYAKIFSMVRSMGREDDILLINFMTGARDIIGPQEKRLSNTLNPFAKGSSSMLSQLVVSLMDGSSKSGDGDMWKGRAIGFVEALMKILVAMRDAGHILLDANTIRNYFSLPRLEAMVIDKLFIRDGQESINLESLPTSIMEPVNNYIDNLPGYNREKKGKQVSQVLEQHGFITMQLTRVFTSLADTYGHILRTNLAEVDLSDVVLNRRILCVLLPALEKSPDELSNLGKIIIATLKAMMAGGLGDSVEGEIRDIVDSRPTNAETPFLCILDEYGYYAVEGFAVVPAQARSLGFSVIFAGQDLPAFQKASKEEAASIGANTNIKICMKLEDPTETWDFFMKSAGESYVSQVENFQMDTNSLFDNYRDGRGARVEKRARIDLLDLKEQAMGEMHVLYKSQIVRSRVFFANPKKVKAMRLNHFIKIDMPTDSDVHRLEKAADQLDYLSLNEESWDYDIVTSEDEVAELANSLEHYSELSPLERSLAILTQQRPSITSDLGIPDSFLQELRGVVTEESGEEFDHYNIFIPLRANEDLASLIIADNTDEFYTPLLDRAKCRDQFEYMERLSGKNSQQSSTISMELVRDIEKGTLYPPEYTMSFTGAEMAAVIDNVINNIIKSKSEDATEED